MPKLTPDQSSASGDVEQGWGWGESPAHQSWGGAVTEGLVHSDSESPGPGVHKAPPGPGSSSRFPPGSGFQASAPPEGLAPPLLWQRLLLISIKCSCALLRRPLSLCLEADEPVRVAERR